MPVSNRAKTRHEERGGLVRVPTGAGGGQIIGGAGESAGLSGSINVRIVGFSTSGKRLRVKLLDAAGAVTGEEFEVRVRIVGDTVGVMDAYPVENNTLPSLNTNQYILIVQATIFDGAEFVTDWWTFDLFGLRGC